MSIPDIDRCERCEIAAWRSIFLSLSSEVAVATGARLLEIDGITISAVSAADILLFNRTVGVGVRHPVAADFTARVAEWYRAAGIPRFFVQVAPGSPSGDTRMVLEAGGLRHYNNWLRLGRELGEDELVAPPTGIEIRRVEEKDDARRFARLVASQFGWPELIDPIAMAPVGAPQWMHYVAVDGEKVIGTGACYRDEDVAWLGFASTDPAYRRRGVQSAIIARRLHDARTMGCSAAVMETAEPRPDHDAPSSRNAERAGFKLLYSRPNYLGVTGVVSG